MKCITSIPFTFRCAWTVTCVQTTCYRYVSVWDLSWTSWSHHPYVAFSHSWGLGPCPCCAHQRVRTLAELLELCIYHVPNKTGYSSSHCFQNLACYSLHLIAVLLCLLECRRGKVRGLRLLCVVCWFLSLCVWLWACVHKHGFGCQMVCVCVYVRAFMLTCVHAPIQSKKYVNLDLLVWFSIMNILACFCWYGYCYNWCPLETEVLHFLNKVQKTTSCEHAVNIIVLLVYAFLLLLRLFVSWK